MSIHVLSISLLHMYRHYIQANSQWHPKDADARWYLIAQNVLRKPPEACASPPERPEGFRASIQVLPKHVSALNWADLAEFTSVSCRINKAGFWAVLWQFYMYVLYILYILLPQYSNANLHTFQGWPDSEAWQAGACRVTHLSYCLCVTLHTSLPLMLQWLYINMIILFIWFLWLLQRQ